MKKLFLSLILLTIAALGMAQNKAIQSVLSYTTFNVPGNKPYIETALVFDCSSLVYKPLGASKFQATVEVQIIFQQGEKVCNYSKIALDSPVIDDTLKITGAFIDQQRFALDNGEYQMEITIKDLNNPKQVPYKAEQTVVINYPADHPVVSDILFVDSFNKATTPTEFTKNGYDIMPRVYSFFLPDAKTLTFYSELYNIDKVYSTEGKYPVKYYIKSY